MAQAIVLAEGCLGKDLGKTANGLVLHAVRDRIAAVIDSTQAGQDAGRVVGGTPNGIPVVASFDDAVKVAPDATTFYLGAATVGGTLPDWFEANFRAALQRGMTVYNGLHTFFGDDPAWAKLAAASGARIVDVRKPPADLTVAHGDARDLKVPRILIMGTDCAVGKRITALELLREAQRRGLDPGFVATGQTGCMLSPDAGAVIDRVPADFAAGQVEKMVCQVAAKGKDLVLVYGQASILHPAYAGVSLAILHGSAPNAVVLQHDPSRSHRTLFDHPTFRVAPLRDEIDLIQRIGHVKVVAIALNGRDTPDIDAAAAAVTAQTGLPAADPLRHGSQVLLDAVLEHLTAQPDGARTLPTVIEEA